MKRRILSALAAFVLVLSSVGTVLAGNTGYEGHPGNQSNGGGSGNTGYEGQPGDQSNN
jgi:hypothetical protein